MEEQSLTGINLEVTGRFLKTVSIRDNWLFPAVDPDSTISEIKKQKISVDIFTFVQSLPDIEPKYAYYMEWDNIAAIQISTFAEWFEKRIHPNVRNKIYKAKKQGIEIRTEPLSDSLVLGMIDIFNESPIRQGRPFPYYGMSFENVRRGWAKDLERSEFLVAYHEREIVGFVKLICGKICARASGDITKLSHRDKAPMNALMAAAVERCASKGMEYLIYGKFSYDRKGEDSLAKFKRYNGFERIEIPRYFVPLSGFGRLALGLRLHHGIKGLLPRSLIDVLVLARAKWYKRIYRRMGGKKNPQNEAKYFLPL